MHVQWRKRHNRNLLSITIEQGGLFDTHVQKSNLKTENVAVVTANIRRQSFKSKLMLFNIFQQFLLYGTPMQECKARHLTKAQKKFFVRISSTYESASTELLTKLIPLNCWYKSSIFTVRRGKILKIAPKSICA